MIAVDTSVVVAAFATWHEAHADASALLLREGPDLPAACELEAYAVLTRLPPPHRVDGAIVADFLQNAFPAPRLTLPAVETARLITKLVSMGISGGASYDAVIALTAASHGRELATLDRRARATYDRVGVEVRSID